jgi:Transposase DDE domain
LSNATLGVVSASELGVRAIGLALARERGLSEKHAVKQIDRFLSNCQIDPWRLAEQWVSYVIGGRKEIITAMDWTDFDADDQATLMISMVTSHGRATPLLWRTFRKSTLASHRNEYEDELLLRLREVVSRDVKVTILADRGFGDQKLYDFIEGELGFQYVIRFRGGIGVTSTDGEMRKAGAWVGPGGRATTLRQAAVTHQRYVVPTIVCVHARGMKEPWCLVSNDPKARATKLIKLYAKRWTIEPSFRDTKDLHFGMGLSWTHIDRPDRRDRVFFIAALAIALLTLLGAAGEALGMDRLLKANTVKRRTDSLFRQGVLYYLKIPTMPEAQFSALMLRFNELIDQQPVLRASLGFI